MGRMPFLSSANPNNFSVSAGVGTPTRTVRSPLLLGFRVVDERGMNQGNIRRQAHAGGGHPESEEDAGPLEPSDR